MPLRGAKMPCAYALLVYNVIHAHPIIALGLFFFTIIILQPLVSNCWGLTLCSVLYRTPSTLYIPLGCWSVTALGPGVINGWHYRQTQTT